MKEQKRALRRELIARRRAMDKKSREEADALIAERVLSLPEYKNADILLLYASYGEETETYKIARAAEKEGKRTAYPLCKENGKMDFLFCKREELLPGFRGIPEPPSGAPRFDVGAADPTVLCIVPALAADKDGFRLGYGGGFYDRFLADFAGISAVTVKSAFLFDRLAREPFDLCCGLTVTEKEVIHNENKRADKKAEAE